MIEENKAVRRVRSEPKSAQPKPLRLDVAQLLQGRRTAILEYGGQDYMLRITVNGKLILTK
jgi:hemin uptake protein HemP